MREDFAAGGEPADEPSLSVLTNTGSWAGSITESRSKGSLASTGTEGPTAASGAEPRPRVEARRPEADLSLVLAYTFLTAGCIAAGLRGERCKKRLSPREGWCHAPLNQQAPAELGKGSPRASNGYRT